MITEDGNENLSARLPRAQRGRRGVDGGELEPMRLPRASAIMTRLRSGVPAGARSAAGAATGARAPAELGDRLGLVRRRCPPSLPDLSAAARLPARARASSGSASRTRTSGPAGPVVAVRPAPAGHRGRGTRAHPVQAGDVRRRPVHGDLHRRVRGPRGTHRDLEIVATGQMMVFLGDHFVITVRRGEHAQLEQPAKQLEAEPERLARGPSRCCTPSPTRSSTTTRRWCPSSSRTWTRSRPGSSPARASTRWIGSTSSSAN